MTKSVKWHALVARGRELVTNIGKFKWELGDLAREVDDEDLGEFAVAVNTSATILARYKKVASFWPSSYRDPQVAFSVYEELLRWSGADPKKAQAEYDRLKKVGVRLAVDDIRMAHGKTPTRPPTGAKGRAEYVKRLADDPDVRRELARDGAFATSFAQEREKVSRQMRETEKQSQRHRAPDLVREYAVVDATTQLNNIKHRIGRVIDTLKDEDLTEQQRKDLLGRASEVADAAALLQDFLGNSAANFEEQVALLLAEGN